MEKNVLHQFINNIPHSLWWKDLDSVFLGGNNKFANYAGLSSSKQLIGKTDFDLWDSNEAEFFRKIDLEIITTGKAQLNFEESITTPELGKRWLSTSKVPLYENDKIVGTVGWFHDITSVKEMQIKIDENNKTLFEYNTQLEKSNRELEVANFDLEKFTYAASHDLKGPLITIKSFAKILKNDNESQLDAKSKEYIDFIYNSTNRMESLINDILNYAQTGSKELIGEYLDLNDIVADKVLDLQQMIDSKSVAVVINLPSDKIKCYPHLIGSLFYNLINNGIKYNDSSTPRIKCDYTESDDHWIFSIEDNGKGIDDKFHDKVFRPFQRLEGESVEGSGIGLSICNRVAKLHMGKIWIEESKKGKTVFNFSISKNLG